MSGFSAPVTNVTQAEVDKLLVNFVCEDNQPFYVMELPLFKKNIYRNLATSVHSHDKENITPQNTGGIRKYEKCTRQEIK